MTVSIDISIDDHDFGSTFTLPNDVSEYVIADEAYRLALLFAETRAIADTGVTPSPRELAEYLKKTTYEYTIS